MIHVRRSRRPPDLPVYREPYRGSQKPKAEQETDAAIAFYSDRAHYRKEKKITKKKPPEFKAYKDEELVALLIKTFNKKCAYCESLFAHVSNEDVEHFRPKNRIDTGSKKLLPGYYWLGSDWNNLLLSCSLCNRRQYHQTPDEEGEILLGKQDLFPLSDESKRIRIHTKDVKGENRHRLLINPCIERKPDSYFEFLENGIVRPAARSGRKRDMAKTSIEVYALQRKDLTDERERNCRELLLQFATVRDAAVDLKDARGGNDAVKIQRREEQLDREWNRLVDRFTLSAPYLAMKRQFVLRAVADGKLDEAISEGKDPTGLLHPSD